MDKHTEKSVHGGDVYRNQVELDFSVNINPFGMPDGVKKALGDAIFLCTQYPDEKVSKLSEAMAKKLVFYLEMVHQSFLWRLSMQESQRLYLCLHRPFQAMSTQQHVRTVRYAIIILKKKIILN